MSESGGESLFSSVGSWSENFSSNGENDFRTNDFERESSDANPGLTDDEDEGYREKRSKTYNYKELNQPNPHPAPPKPPVLQLKKFLSITNLTSDLTASSSLSVEMVCAFIDRCQFLCLEMKSITSSCAKMLMNFSSTATTSSTAI